MPSYNWTFDGSVENWRSNGDGITVAPTGPATLAGTRNAIVGVDSASGSPWFFTPEEISGDQSKLYGETFTYAWQSQATGPVALTQMNLHLFAQDGSRIRLIDDFADRSGQNTYTGTFSAVLAPTSSQTIPTVAVQYLAAGGSSWVTATQADIQAVLSNLNYIAISGDVRINDEFTRIEGASLTCFTRGTLLETDRGPLAVEALKVGDQLYTRDNGLQPIRWIGSRKLSAAALAAMPKLRPIRIKAGALGANTPSTDLDVSPQHRILVRSKITQRMFNADEVLIAAKHLLEIDGIDVVNDTVEVEYFHILFDQHEIVFSNGAETESLYTGKEALKSLNDDARDEIFTLFPELRNPDPAVRPNSARHLVEGRLAKQAVLRHNRNARELVAAE